MGVNAADHGDRPRCNACPCRSFGSVGWGRHRPWPMTDTTVKGRLWSGSHQVTLSVEAGSSTGCPRATDMSVE